jgi:3-deoxy-7-phosphoheptulonate synthase
MKTAEKPGKGSADTAEQADFPLVGRAFHPENTVVNAAGVRVGGEELVLMAGPCSVESEDQIFALAAVVAQAGGSILRGGAYKPRTSPYAFQGLGAEGLGFLRRAADAHGLAVVTEAVDATHVGRVAEYADIVQIGARNMQNYSLLSAAGSVGRPVLLKRGMSATLREFLLAAEYVASHGNPDVILCERGMRTFADHCRFTLDLAAVPVLRQRSHLPVIVDPSHCAGDRRRVLPLARAGVAAGADGLLVEVHHRPHEALSDGEQSLLPAQLERLAREMVAFGPILGRRFPGPAR